MSDRLDLNFPACLADDFPRQLPAAEAAVARVFAAIRGASFDSLVERSPGLRDADFAHYLRCSIARMVHAGGALDRSGVAGGRMLDYGAYFANYALMFTALGFSVDAADSYRAYQSALGPILDLLPGEGVRPLAFEDVGRDLVGIPPETYDVVLCMGVIEHIPHTPRMMLESIDRVLKPGGVLLLETPNLAHLYNRQKLARGEAIMTPLDIQYYATLPFEGHHREYTTAEVVWMVGQLGHTVLRTELFNYSGYEQQTLTGRDVTNHWRMVADPTARELILVTSQKPRAGASPVPLADWRATLEDPEQFWQRAAPAGAAAERGEAIVATERLLVDLQQAVVTRDRMLADLQAERTFEVERRDREIAALNSRLGAIQRALDTTLDQRLRRLWQRVQGRQG